MTKQEYLERANYLLDTGDIDLNTHEVLLKAIEQLSDEDDGEGDIYEN